MNAKRRKAQDLMRLLIDNEPKVHYEQRRPFQTCWLTEAQLRGKLRTRQGVTMDCSEAITLICRLAGLKDPNGLGYRSCAGNTETMLNYLPHYRWAGYAQVGAIVHFVHEDHACMVLKRGIDPVLFSHGGERGPLAVKLSVERTFHPGPVTFLSIRRLL